MNQSNRRWFSPLVRTVCHGEVIPWWMGIAYERVWRSDSVCIVLPLNWPVWLARAIYWRCWLFLAITPSDWHCRQMEASFRRGFDHAADGRLRDFSNRQIFQELQHRALIGRVPGARHANLLRTAYEDGFRDGHADAAQQRRNRSV